MFTPNRCAARATLVQCQRLNSLSLEHDKAMRTDVGTGAPLLAINALRTCLWRRPIRCGMHPISHNSRSMGDAIHAFGMAKSNQKRRLQAAVIIGNELLPLS